MTTKERLFGLLDENRGRFISGEEIASSLLVSRAAVWKGIQSLRRDGYEIEAVRNKGYMMPERTDILSASGVLKYLEDLSGRYGLLIDVQKSVTSTNTVLKERAQKGGTEGCVLIAANQTAGKGRVGRSFYSPENTGVYLSILLRPEAYDAVRASRFTTMAAVAACKAVEELTDDQALIKWVNDVYLHDRKIAGILTEASIDLESGYIEYAVLGIGFNVYEPVNGFPDEIRNRAGSILKTQERDAKNKLAAAFIRYFMACYHDDQSAQDYIHEYRERRFLVGHEIEVIEGEKRTPAYALSVDDECRLIVRYANGMTEALSAGEVSICI